MYPSVIPNAASGAIAAPPMLCATFHTDIFTPRSLVQNQCVMTRPQGGQPMPCIQPLTNSRQNIAMMATGIEIDPHGSTP